MLRDALVRTAETHGPGLVGLVTEHGEPVFEGAVGVADLADGRPPTADDWFRIGSVTKTYVSAVLVQLLRKGAFARSDAVEQWLPGRAADRRRPDDRALPERDRPARRAHLGRAVRRGRARRRVRVAVTALLSSTRAGSASAGTPGW